MTATDTSGRSASDGPSPLGAWLQAIRPATLTAALGPVAVGTGLAIGDGAFDASAAIAALLGATFIQIGTNLYNDYADFVKGADTDERLGPARAVQRGWLGPRAVELGAYAAFGVAALFGAYLILVAGCLRKNLSSSKKDLVAIQRSFRAYATSNARAAELERLEAEAAAASAEAREFENDDMAASRALDGTVGATSVGRIGYRYER